MFGAHSPLFLYLSLLISTNILSQGSPDIPLYPLLFILAVSVSSVPSRTSLPCISLASLMLLPCTPLFSFFTLLSLSRKLSVDADQILKSCSFGTPSPFVAGAPLGLAPLAHQCLPYPFPRTLLRSPEKPGSGPPSVSWPAPYVCYLVKFRGSVVRCSRVFNVNVGQE
jgi:hypothetical protein